MLQSANKTSGRRAIPGLLGAFALLAAVGSAGCEATIHPPELGITYRESALAPAPWVPEDIWAYPHVVYGGSYVYLVDGRWYYPTPSGWMMFRREPVELSRQRTILGQGRTPYYGYPR